MIESEPNLMRSNLKPNEQIFLRQSGRVPRQLNRYLGFLVWDGDPIELDEKDEDPITYMDAIQRSDSEAMRFEMESMKVNDVWTIVDPPEGINSIGY